MFFFLGGGGKVPIKNFVCKVSTLEISPTISCSTSVQVFFNFSKKSLTAVPSLCIINGAPCSGGLIHQVLSLMAQGSRVQIPSPNFFLLEEGCIVKWNEERNREVKRSV